MLVGLAVGIAGDDGGVKKSPADAGESPGGGVLRAAGNGCIEIAGHIIQASNYAAVTLVAVALANQQVARARLTDP